ncbi:MAG: hypothetical protein DHS20C16_11380 [Phycisphaerae bacterium]|nr:MAG: hypothetical protein DHS20C16_11380 [Phycisphaerae bacterium]
MKTRILIVVLGMLMSVPSARAYQLSLELLSDTELTVEQTFWHDLNGWNPIGEPLLVWGRLSNNGAELVQLSGIGGFIPEISYGTSWPFVTEYNPIEYFNPDTDPNDPFIRNGFGDYAVELEPGESVDIPFDQIWGLSYMNYPTFALPIGTRGQLDGGRIVYWEFDQSPNDATHGPPTVSVELDRGFAVTVVPEPSSLVWFVGAASCGAWRRR